MPVSADKVYEFGEWHLDPAEHLLLRSGSPVPLGPKLFDTNYTGVSSKIQFEANGDLKNPGVTLYVYKGEDRVPMN